MAERSKAPESGSGPKGREFESHCCQKVFSFVLLVTITNSICTAHTNPSREEENYSNLSLLSDKPSDVVIDLSGNPGDTRTHVASICFNCGSASMTFRLYPAMSDTWHGFPSRYSVSRVVIDRSSLSRACRSGILLLFI